MYKWYHLGAFICFFHASVCLADQPRIDAYLHGRNQALAEDAKINFSSGMRLNLQEQKLDTKIQELVLSLQKSYATSKRFPPARIFMQVKQMIEESELFKLLEKMPKGGVLHLHTSATGDAHWFVNHALLYDNSYIYLEDDGKELYGTMAFFINEEIPPGYRSMKAVSQEDAEFVEKVVALITMQNEDVLSPNPWDKFECCFTRISGLLDYAPFCRMYTERDSKFGMQSAPKPRGSEIVSDPILLNMGSLTISDPRGFSRSSPAKF